MARCDGVGGMRHFGAEAEAAAKVCGSRGAAASAMRMSLPLPSYGIMPYRPFSSGMGKLPWLRGLGRTRAVVLYSGTLATPMYPVGEAERMVWVARRGQAADARGVARACSRDRRDLLIGAGETSWWPGRTTHIL